MSKKKFQEKSNYFINRDHLIRIQFRNVSIIFGLGENRG